MSAATLLIIIAGSISGFFVSLAIVPHQIAVGVLCGQIGQSIFIYTWQRLTR